MKRLRVLPLAAPVSSEATVPGSKSYTNRALFIAAVAKGPVKIKNPLISDDIEAMIACLTTLGIGVRRSADSLEVIGDIGAVKDGMYDLNAGLSGITLRFMLALSAVIPGEQTLQGKAGLNKRPIGDMVDSLRQLGAEITYLEKEGFPPLRVSSSMLSKGPPTLSGTTSSQYLSALLLIAPQVGDLGIKISGELVSKPYIDMTIRVMKDFGVAVTAESYQAFHVAGGQTYRGVDYKVEGDISSACYFFAIAVLTKSTITVKNINPESLQADMGFLDILEQMGATVSHGKNSITVVGKGVKPLSVDMQDCPDQAQTLAVLAAFAEGVTTISGIKSLRVKETERVNALEQELKKMGIKTSSTKDTLVIRGGKPAPTSIQTYGDHRMAMAFAVAGAELEGMEIEEPDVVSKTFPDFWKQLANAGVTTAPILSNIVLIGMRGSGKTTVAGYLSQKLHIEHLDLDEIMEERTGMTTADIVKKRGWTYFRNQETAIAKEVAKLDNALITTGGGIILRPDNIKALKKNGIMVLLSASIEVLLDRLSNSYDRPALTNEKTPRAEVELVLRERRDIYESTADIVIDTDKLSPEQVADRIVSLLKEYAQ